MLPGEHAATAVLADIVTASKRAAGFCRQMLAYSGQGPVRRSRIDVRALVPQVSSLVGAAVSKKATLQYALHDGEVFVEGDESQLLQVIMNLVANAADALGDTEGTISVTSDVRRYEADDLERLAPRGGLAAGEYVRITVADTGCGMDVETAQRMFDPFFTTKVTGHGLGLAAVKGIVRDHGGALAIESKLGEGTSMTVVLPTTGPAAAAVVHASAATSAPGGRKRILLADDEADLRSILSKQLGLEGFEVVEAADGEHALDVFREDPASIDCVLLDLSMPKLSGDEVLGGLRAIRDDIPVVLMSGYARESLWNRFVDEQITEFLQKPIAAADLQAAIRAATASGVELSASD